jgi:two-component system, NtrC family, response regulator HydG
MFWLVEDGEAWFTNVRARGGARLAANVVNEPAKLGTSVNARVLVVDDEPDICASIQVTLEREGYVVTSFTSASAALQRARDEDFDVFLTDLQMAEMDGLSLCERVLGVRPDVPVIVVTGQGSMKVAIEAIRVGAYDFITKPLDAELLAHSVRRAVQHRQVHAEVKRLHAASAGEVDRELMVGESEAMLELSNLVSRLAQRDTSVLIYGETGTGKELVARALHAASPRSAGPFIAINCAAVPAALLESELFGHARGAFTDAKNRRKGLLVEANGGTVLLDEVGELPLDVQPKLLRALQERTVRPVGENAEVPFDARIITSTHRDLEYEVFEKRFREDLFYRLNVVKIDLPPLRERGGDVLRLAQHFLSRFAKSGGATALALSASAAEKLLAYDWPGNVRELENCIERVVALARYDHVTVEDLPEKIRAYRAERFVVSADALADVVTLEELERRYVLRVLALVRGNKSRAAGILGVDRRTLYRKLEKYEAPPSGGLRAPHASVEPAGRKPPPGVQDHRRDHKRLAPIRR